MEEYIVMKRIYTIALPFFLTLLICLISGSSVTAKDKEGYAGWEIGSAYNNLYDAKEKDKLKGRIAEFKTVTPLEGMAPGTAFVLEEAKDDKTLVHLCPRAYAKAKETGLKKGDKVKVKGSWVEIDGEDVFVASKVKRGEHFQFKVRLTSDGTPFWTMSPERLKQEMKQQ